MSAEVVSLLDALALAQAADAAGITLSQARRFAAALGEMQAQQMARVVGESARIERCGRERAAKKKERSNA